MKNGLSSVIAVVLLMLIVVAGIALIWTSVLPMLKESTKVNERADIFIDTSGGYTAYDAEKKIACVQIGRGVDSTSLVAVNISFLIAGQTTSSFRVPLSNESIYLNSKKTYCFDLSSYAVPESVLIFPVYNNGQIGEAQTTALPNYNFNRVPGDLINLNGNGLKFRSIPKITAMYIGGSDITGANLDKIKSAGFNTIIIRDGTLDYIYYNFSKGLDDRIISNSKWAKDNNISLFISIHAFNDQGGDVTSRFEKAVFSDGSELNQFSPWSEDYWAKETQIIKSAAKFARENSSTNRIDGVWFDFEMYNIMGGAYVNFSWGFEDSLFYNFTSSKGLNVQVARNQRNSWLQQNNLFEEYKIFLQNKMYSLVRKMFLEVKAENPNFFFGAYPSIIPSRPYLDDIYSAWSDPDLPAITWGTDTYGFGGKIPLWVNSSNLIAGTNEYNLTGIFNHPSGVPNRAIYAYYSAGVLVGQYPVSNYSLFYDFSRQSNGYWVFSFTNLLKSCEQLTTSYGLSGYRIPVGCDTDIRNPGCCKNQAMLGDSLWVSDCCPYYSDEVNRAFQKFSEANSMIGSL